MSDTDTVTIEMMQQTLSGGEQLIQDVEEIRGRPDTFVECPECGEEVLRSRQFDHEHEIFWARRGGSGGDGDGGDEEGDDGDDEPEKVGGMYEIELSYSAEFRFRIPAWSEHEAKRRAEDLVDYPNNCADMFQVHSRDREITEIFGDHDKLPDDFDPYDGTPLWEVWGDE